MEIVVGYDGDNGKWVHRMLGKLIEENDVIALVVRFDEPLRDK